MNKPEQYGRLPDVHLTFAFAAFRILSFARYYYNYLVSGNNVYYSKCSTNSSESSLANIVIYLISNEYCF